MDSDPKFKGLSFRPKSGHPLDRFWVLVKRFPTPQNFQNFFCFRTTRQFWTLLWVSFGSQSLVTVPRRFLRFSSKTSLQALQRPQPDGRIGRWNDFLLNPHAGTPHAHSHVLKCFKGSLGTLITLCTPMFVDISGLHMQKLEVMQILDFDWIWPNSWF